MRGIHIFTAYAWAFGTAFWGWMAYLIHTEPAGVLAFIIALGCGFTAYSHARMVGPKE